MGGEQQAIEAYKLEVGGVPEVGVAVQRSLEQRPPGARKRRRATAGHLCSPPRVFAKSGGGCGLTDQICSTPVGWALRVSDY